jgi:tetratricopeptide (TPR) repeat protein
MRDTEMNGPATRIAALVAGLALAATGCTNLQSWGPISNLAPPSYSPETKLKIARVQEQRGQLAKAQEIYSDLYRRNPQNVEVCQRLAVVSARMGDTAQSERYFAEAMRLNPNRAGLLTDYGYAKLTNKDYAGAEQLLRRAVANSPGDKRALNNLAIALGYQGKHEQSLATFRRVVPEAQAQANLAYIHTQRGEGRLAVQRYSRAVELDNNLRSAAHALLQLAEMEQRYLKSERGRRQVAELKAKQSKDEASTDAHAPRLQADPSNVKLVKAAGPEPSSVKQADWTKSRKSQPPASAPTSNPAVPRKTATLSATSRSTPVSAAGKKSAVGGVEPRKTDSPEIVDRRGPVTVPEKPVADQHGSSEPFPAHQPAGREVPVVSDTRAAKPVPAQPQHRASAQPTGPFAGIPSRDTQHDVSQPAAATPAGRWDHSKEQNHRAAFVPPVTADGGKSETAPPQDAPPVRIRLKPAVDRSPAGRVRLTAGE